MIIAIDFDGTIVKHDFPAIGDPVPHALETLRMLLENGHDLLLWTVRIGQPLQAAYDYCRKNGITFFGVNENPTQKFWNGSPKAYAELYIDDAALGCPLITDDHPRPFVNWLAVRATLTHMLQEDYID